MKSNIKNLMYQNRLISIVNKEMAEELIKNKADVNVADNESETPLHYAVHTGKMKLYQTSSIS